MISPLGRMYAKEASTLILSLLYLVSVSNPLTKQENLRSCFHSVQILQPRCLQKILDEKRSEPEEGLRLIAEIILSLNPLCPSPSRAASHSSL